MAHGRRHETTATDRLRIALIVGTLVPGRCGEAIGVYGPGSARCRCGCAGLQPDTG